MQCNNKQICLKQSGFGCDILIGSSDNSMDSDWVD